MDVHGEEGPDGLQQADALEQMEAAEHPVQAAELDEIVFRRQDWKRMMVAKKGRPSDLRQLLSELQAAVDAWGGLPRTSERLKRSTSSPASDRAVVCNRFTFAAMQDIFKTQLQDLKNRFEGQGDNRISGMPKSLICCHL